MPAFFGFRFDFAMPASIAESIACRRARVGMYIPISHGAANPFISAMIRIEVGRYFHRPHEGCDRLAERAIDWAEDVPEEALALFNELSRSCSPEVAERLVSALEHELDEREIDDAGRPT